MTKTTDKPSLRPLTENERVGLHVARVRSHVSQAMQLDAQMREVMQRINELDRERQAAVAHVQDLNNGVVVLVAEAREEVSTLLNLGMTQEEVDGLAPIPAKFTAVSLESLVPERLRKTPTENKT